MKYVKLALSFVHAKLLALWVAFQRKIMELYLSVLEKLAACCSKFVAEREGKGGLKSLLVGPAAYAGVKFNTEAKSVNAELAKLNGDVAKEEEK